MSDTAAATTASCDARAPKKERRAGTKARINLGGGGPTFFGERLRVGERVRPAAIVDDDVEACFHCHPGKSRSDLSGTP